MPHPPVAGAWGPKITHGVSAEQPSCPTDHDFPPFEDVTATNVVDRSDIKGKKMFRE
jgi:hypothetical protein